MGAWRLKTRRGELDLRKARSVGSRFAPYALMQRWTLLAALLAAVGATAMELAAPWTIKLIFDYVLTDQMTTGWLAGLLRRLADTPMGALAWICAAILVIASLDGVFCHVRDVQLAQAGQKVVGKIRQDLFDHLQTLPPSVFEQHRTGDLLARLTGDILMLRQMLVGVLVTAGQNALLIVAMIAALFWLHPGLAALGLLTIPVTAWSAWHISGQIRRAATSQREKESLSATIAHDVLGAIPIIQAFNREAIERDRFGRLNRSSVRAGVKTTRLESRLYRTITLASAAATCLILFFGVRSVLHKAMTAGDLLVFLAYLKGMSKPLRQVAKVTGSLAKATTCGQRVLELLDIEPMIRNRPGAIKLSSSDGAIAFHDVTFSYGAGPVLSQVTFDTRPGERLAIVGATGAGKSTILKLILRFYDPDQGAITLDGQDLRNLTKGSLRRQVGWVHQDTVLFGMSVLENLTLGRTDVDLEQVRAVARSVQADAFISALPQGYDTVLGQSGLTLSGGQRQRLALARALLRSTPILLLDEPATGLDAMTREVVEEAWMSAANRATTIVVCHRLSRMERFDRVMLVDEGRIVGLAPHAELMTTHPAYTRMIAAGSFNGEPRLREEAMSWPS